MIKRFVLILSVLMTVVFTSSAASPFDKGQYLRLGIGFPDNINIGAGCYLTENFTLGIEATSVNGLGGYAAAVDARYYFSDFAVKPFVGGTAGYGVIGKNINYKNVWDFAGSAMAGVSFERMDLAIGATLDPFNDIMPMISFSYTIPFRIK